jgi:hypothetical protein
MPKYAKIFNLWALELGQKQRATCSIACLTGRARTGRGSARPARGRPAPRICTSPSPINASRGLSRWHSRTQSLARARGHRSSLWKASTTARHHCPSTAVVTSPFCWTQPRPSPWTASPWRREASPSLSWGIASLERRIHPRRTSVTRRRAWTELTSKSSSNFLHPRLPQHPVKLFEPFNWPIVPWLGRTPHRRRASPSAHVDQPTPTILDSDPHIVVILKTSPTSSTTSPEQPRRR